MNESALSWLDLDEEGRRRMQEQLALLNEPDTVDELGVGQVRDVFSNMFFPGTSTLWRRARYLLFVPWIYRDLELHGTGGRSGPVAARSKQSQLIRALKASGDTEGLIGARTDEPQRMPDELLWYGMLAWGIRRREGSMGKYRRSLESGDASRFEVTRGDFEEVIDSENGSWWHPRLPAAPRAFLKWSEFDLTEDEGFFLRDQLEEHANGSVLHCMTSEDPIWAEADYVWEQTDAINRLGEDMQIAVDHARLFSYAIEGARILYSLEIARAKSADSQDVEDRMGDWAETIETHGIAGELRRWNSRSDGFWHLIRSKNRGLRSGTQEFVDTWIEKIAKDPGSVAQDSGAALMIKEREWKVKRSLARLSNRKALDRARAVAPAGRLGFRWFQGSSIINDIVRAVEHAE